jgi:hypothetical protein
MVIIVSEAYIARSRADRDGVVSQLSARGDANRPYIVWCPGACEPSASEGLDRPPGISDGEKSAGRGDKS